jgi:hypothetical protein
MPLLSARDDRQGNVPVLQNDQFMLTRTLRPGSL